MYIARKIRIKNFKSIVICIELVIVESYKKKKKSKRQKEKFLVSSIKKNRTFFCRVR